MASAGKVRVLHLLCKNEKSRNPVSRRTQASTASVSVASAHEELKAIMGRLEGKSGQDARLQKVATWDSSDQAKCKKSSRTPKQFTESVLLLSVFAPELGPDLQGGIFCS
eukprot:Skav232948  [mRNA]  locus=scaffold1860:72844:74578:- [translate_table: standard]